MLLEASESEQNGQFHCIVWPGLMTDLPVDFTSGG